jgi:hypothetical protein cfetvA_06693
MSEKKIKSERDLAKDFMENNVCPKCGSKNWVLGSRDYDLKCGGCGYLLYDINPIKNTCHELNLTYKQLGEAIGYGEGAIKNSASTGNISEPMAHAIKMYKRILELEREISDSETLKENLKKWLK